MVASMLPRNIKVSLETMSDEQLHNRIDEVTRLLGVKLVSIN